MVRFFRSVRDMRLELDLEARRLHRVNAGYGAILRTYECRVGEEVWKAEIFMDVDRYGFGPRTLLTPRARLQPAPAVAFEDPIAGAVQLRPLVHPNPSIDPLSPDWHTDREAAQRLHKIGHQMRERASVYIASATSSPGSLHRARLIHGAALQNGWAAASYQIDVEEPTADDPPFVAIQGCELLLSIADMMIVEGTAVSRGVAYEMGIWKRLHQSPVVVVWPLGETLDECNAVQDPFNIHWRYGSTNELDWFFRGPAFTFLKDDVKVERLRHFQRVGRRPKGALSFRHGGGPGEPARSASA